MQAFQLAAHQPQAPAARLSDLALSQLAAGETGSARETAAEIARRIESDRDPASRSALFTNVLACSWDPATAESLVRHAAGNVAQQRNATTLHFHGAALYRAGEYAQAERTLAESVKTQGGGGFADTSLFQALTARQRGKYDESVRQLARFEEWLRQQKFSTWQQRVMWDALLREARRVVHTPPPMSKVGPGE
jgi:Tfp pilus assembly protein PilF